MTGRVDYDEFGLFHENAATYGLPLDGPPTVRRAFADVARGRRLSALVWQDRDPDLRWVLFVLPGAFLVASVLDLIQLTWGGSAAAVARPGVPATTASFLSCSPCTACRCCFRHEHAYGTC